MAASSQRDEVLRILQAACDERLRINEYGRYVIAGEARPARKPRELAQRRGWLGWRYEHGGSQPILTDSGRKMLDLLGGTEAIIATESAP